MLNPTLSGLPATLRLLLVCFALVSTLACRSTTTLPHQNSGHDGLALEGYDPVSYFDAEMPLRGSSDFTVRHDQLVYRFASLENQERFQRDPERYVPAYGGWCAYAMADGQKVEIDPKAFLVQEGRLLLFYRSFWSDTRKLWLNDADALLERADEHWTRISAER